LSAPVLGWEDWQDKKPVRFRFEEKPGKPIDATKPVKHFWAFIVWNYLEKKIQILQITQTTIRNKIEALSKDEEWGAPYFYDLKIIKKGEGVKTEYEVNPAPHRALTPEVMNAFKSKPCNLEALFESGDPFDLSWSVFTAGIFGEPVGQKNEENGEERLKSFLNLFSEEEEREVSIYIAKFTKAYKYTLSKALDELIPKGKDAILADIAKWKARSA
jgi:hypothetical protein